MTAVQQVFSDLEKLQPHLFNMHSVEGREFVNHFHKYLAVEKQQMCNFFREGYMWCNSPSLRIENGEIVTSTMKYGEFYYNEIYKSE